MNLSPAAGQSVAFTQNHPVSEIGRAQSHGALRFAANTPEPPNSPETQGSEASKGPRSPILRALLAAHRFLQNNLGGYARIEPGNGAPPFRITRQAHEETSQPPQDPTEN